jgi:hypothetical protein
MPYRRKLVAMLWGSAAVFAAAPILKRYLVQLRDPAACYLARHKPLAGPREGAELPG